MKPMNCPSHCLIFGSRRRSYRELPWRVADFGRLQRYERGGVVHGLNRVRSFCQDDAHIFCAPDAIQAEIQSFVDLLYQVYGALGLTDVAIKLATRPEKRVGTDAQWDAAAKALADALGEKQLPFEISPREGAHYGPKLEFHVKDAIKRSWQLGTIQVDYALPDRFELEFVGEDGHAHRPVMLHRAILGSLERFLGVYIEHVAGAFPVWLAPEQVSLVTVSWKQADYAPEARAANPHQPSNPSPRGPRCRRRRWNVGCDDHRRSSQDRAGAGSRPGRGEPQSRAAGLQASRFRKIQIRREKESARGKAQTDQRR